MTTATSTATTQQARFQQAVRAIRKHDITTLQNARKCCRSCLSYDLGAEGKVPYAYTYGSQGSAYTWRDDRPVYVAGTQSPVDQILWNYSELATGKVIAEEFTKLGFTVDWDGTEMHCVGIKFAD